MSDPIEAVLVRDQGLDRWCVREVARYAAGKLVEDYVYAYRDCVTGEHLPPGRCKEVRDGFVRVECVEVNE